MARQLPIIKYNSKYYFWDERLKQIRNIEDPHDFLGFQELDMNRVEEP